MIYRSLFPRDVLAELDRLRRDMQDGFDFSPSIRGIGRGGFPAMNVGGSSRAIEIYAFMPGVDPAQVEVQLENGVLTISGERKSDMPTEKSQRSDIHIAERFSGRFRRVVTLSEDADPNAVSAVYRDGVLHITVQRRAAAQPRRIAIQ